MAIIMGKGCIEAIYGLMGWKGLSTKTLPPLDVFEFIYKQLRMYVND